MKNKFINSSLIVNLYRDKSLKSSLDTQLIYGESYKIIKKYLRWKKKLKSLMMDMLDL